MVDPMCYRRPYSSAFPCSGTSRPNVSKGLRHDEKAKGSNWRGNGGTSHVIQKHGTSGRQSYQPQSSAGNQGFAKKGFAKRWQSPPGTLS
jgi:hypothetical protein